jgi:hypothetical protein
VVAPERIERGLESAVEEEETFLADVGLSLMKFRSTLWLTELRLQIQAVNHYWDAWVVGYTPSVQMSLLTRYFGDLDRKTMGIILLSGFFGLLAITALFLLLKRSQHKLAPIEQEYLKFCRMLEGLNLGRHCGEGPIDYANRVGEQRPDLAPGVRAVTNAYVKANFINDDPKDIDLMKRAIRNMKVRAFA